MAERETEEGKLKALEKSLAQELDPGLKTSGMGAAVESGTGRENTAVLSSPAANDSGATSVGGDTATGSGFNVAAGGTQAPTASANTGGGGDEISLDNLDALISKADPVFSANMSRLKEGLDEDMAKTKEAPSAPALPDEAVEVRKTHRNWKEIAVGVAKVITFPLLLPFRFGDWVYDFIEQIRAMDWKNYKLVLKNWFVAKNKIYKEKKKVLDAEAESVKLWFEGLGWGARLRLVALVVTTAICVWYLKNFLGGRIDIHYPGRDFIESFEQVADEVFPFDETEQLEGFDSPLRHPEYAVLMNKLVVNLKFNTHASARPMAAMELILEGSSRESAIEIGDRMTEIRDLVSRIAEETPYDDLTSEEGKKKFKRMIRRDINAVMNNGRVKNVRFKTFFYKP